jgi:hypothetical protein
MPQRPVDYDALAKQYGGVPHVDYDTLAAQYGGTAQPTPTPFVDMSHVAGAGPNGVPQLAAHPQTPAMQSSLLAPSTYGKAISDTVSGLAKPLAHIPSQIGSYGGFVDPSKQGGPIQSIVNNPDKGAGVADALVQSGAALALGKAFEAAPRVANAASSKASDFLGKTPVQGQNYTNGHAASFEGAIAPATAMGKNFIPQNITSEALSPIRTTASRMAQGTPVERGIVKAATSTSTPPLEQLGAYQSIVKTALGDLEAQHAPALAQSSDIPVDTSGIVKELRSKISPTMAPADRAAIQELMERTQNAKTIGDLNTFRQELNTSTSSIYRKNSVQAGSAPLGAQIEDDLAGWVRNAYYDELGNATGTDFSPLKRQEANLINVQESLENQQTPLAKAQATFNAPTTVRQKAGNFANIFKDPKAGVTQTILREAPAAKTAFLLRRSLTNLPEFFPEVAPVNSPQAGISPQQPLLGRGQPETIRGTPVDPFPPQGPPRLGNPQGTLQAPITLRGLPSRYSPPQLPTSTTGFTPEPASPPPPFNPDTARMRVQPNQFRSPDTIPSRGSIAVSPAGDASLPAKGLPSPTPATKAPALAGKALWAQRGAAKMEAHGISPSDIDALRQTAKGKQLLIIASDLTPGSAAMKSLARQIPTVLGK